MPNIFTDIPTTLPEEVFESLLTSQHIQLERIISRGHVTPADTWYDQAWHEWVILLQGEARLLMADPDRIVDLKAGDYVYLPAHQRHRVVQTSTKPEAIWLALHIKPD
jgi:cupin 2 domain-containing protein